ncbi:transposable element Tcb2 transposase [Trichonephila clavipes]|uniref:Transposable element Tcb2 transposase n=1 Tax=Trichonephila clavipes TaxID=2585209 RepID=A0A8X6RPC8_TRICX|nr:transposable element Tcb2 transposase [Trichonephila clavipes]
MQRDCDLRIAGRGRLTSFSVEYKKGNQSFYECAESFTEEELSSSIGPLLLCCEEVLGPVNPRDVIYTKTRLKTPSTEQSSRKPLHPEWNHVARIRNGIRISDESRFNLSSDDNRVRLWRPRCGRLNPAFALQRHTTPTAGVMVWCVVAYNTRSPLLLIRGPRTAQWYVHDILHSHVLPLIQRFPCAFFQQDNAQPKMVRVSQDCLRTVTTLP